MQTAKERAASILKELTLEEKAKLCTGHTYWTTFPLERFGISECVMSDGPHGVRKVKEKDHLGQAVNERATGFPTSVAMSATWNKKLLYETGQVLGRECQGIGVDILLGPAVNLKRSVLGGRNFEYFSEDPVLAGKLAASMVNGIQSTGTGACMKHFACNNSETNRMTVDVTVDERTLHELYLKVFEIIVKESHPAAVMGAYNKVNGHYACENKELLTEILREDWGFDGIVLSDWLAVDDCVKAVKAGLNLEMPSNPLTTKKLMEAVQKGELEEAELDKRVLELLTVILKLESQRNPKPIPWEEHKKAAEKVAAESIVLVKNEGNLLPFQWEKIRKAAVIGDFAVHPRTQGGGSSKVEAEQEETILEAIQRLAGEKTEILYAKGYEESGETNEQLLQGAVKAAEESDAVIVFAGLPESYESEGYDRSNMKMPEGHLELIQRIAAVRKDILVVLSNGSPVELPFLDSVDAVLEAWLLGQETAKALSDVIMNRKQPAGRMPETFPKTLEEEPAGYNFKVDENTLVYGERMLIGYRYYEKKKIKPAIPFGHGLSYTEFTYTNLTVSKEEITDQEQVQIEMDVTNTGNYPGFEVVQLYVSNQQKKRLHPEKELKDFEKIYLQPQETRHVCFTLDRESFQCYSRQAGSWLTEEGFYEILIGASSQDIRLRKTIRVSAEQPWIPKLTEKSTLEEWLAHPEGKPMAEEMLSKYRGFGMGNGRKFEELSHFVQRIMLEMPMPRLVTASQGSFTEEELLSMAEKIKEETT